MYAFIQCVLYIYIYTADWSVLFTTSSLSNDQKFQKQNLDHTGNCSIIPAYS